MHFRTLFWAHKVRDSLSRFVLYGFSKSYQLDNNLSREETLQVLNNHSAPMPYITIGDCKPIGQPRLKGCCFRVQKKLRHPCRDV